MMLHSFSTEFDVEYTTYREDCPTRSRSRPSRSSRRSRKQGWHEPLSSDPRRSEGAPAASSHKGARGARSIGIRARPGRGRRSGWMGVRSVMGRVERGEIRLCRISGDKRRPVVVLTRASAIPYLTRVTVAPITSTIRSVPTEVVLGVEDGLKHRSAVNLHNAVTVERKRLETRIAQLSAARLREVCNAIKFALGCES